MYTKLYSRYVAVGTEPNAANEVYGLCPFHVDSRPSFSYNEETGLWYCFKCRKGGSATEFIQEIEKCSLDDATKIVGDVLGKPTLPGKDEISDWRTTLKNAHTVLAYLERRGIVDEKLLDAYEVGFDGERITVPVRDINGNLLNVRRLRVGTDGDKVLNWRGFGKVQVWPVDQLSSADTVLLCAGEIDALSAIQQGYHAVTGTGGESVWRQDLTPLFLGKTVYIVYDGDETGKEGARERAKDLAGTARNIYIVNLPDGEDTNSLHQKGVTLEEFLKAATPVGVSGARLVSGIELLHEAAAESKRPWIIENLLRPGWLGVIGGHGKGGKTTFATHLMKAVQSGQPFLGFPVRPCKALYISYEMAVIDLSELYRDVVGEDANKWPMTVLEPPRPLRPEDLQQFLDVDPGVVIIDSATPAFNLRGDAENSAGEVGYYLRGIQEVARRLGWAVLIIHHTRKSGTGTYLDLAGSREWVAAPDVILTWEKAGIGEPGTLRIEGRVPPSEALSVNLTRQELTLLGTKDILETAKAKREIEKLIKENPGRTAADIAALTQLSPTYIWKVLQEGDFVRLGDGKRGSPHVWYHISNVPATGRN